MTSIDIGIRIDEPVTTLTDLLVSAVCFVAFFRLRKQSRSGLFAGMRSNTQLYFRSYFLLMAIATLFGGVIGHAFLYALSFPWKLPGWIVSMLSVALIERSSIEHAKPLINPLVAKVFLGMNIVELVTVMTITLWTLDFRWVEFHSGYGLLGVVLPFHFYTWYRTRNKGSFVIITAVLIASCAALVFMNKLSIHEWFNYIDISHTMIAIGAYVFYRGAKLLGQ